MINFDRTVTCAANLHPPPPLPASLHVDEASDNEMFKDGK